MNAQTPNVPLVDLDAYLDRIGYAGPVAPTYAVLADLITHHIAAIPFEALDVLAGKGVDLDPAAVDAKLIAARRGGYCYEQNNLFRRVLLAIGFEAEGLLARVRWMLPLETPTTSRSHMLVRVTIDGVPWLADVGFGSIVPDAPLRMDITTPQATGHDRFRLVPSEDHLDLEAELDGAWATVYQIDRRRQYEIDYAVANWFTSTNPVSHFRHQLIAARTTPQARYMLRDGRFTVRRPGQPPERRFLDADEIERALAEIFTLPVDPAWRPLIARAAAAAV